MISLIIVNTNGLKFLPRFFDTISKQTYKDTEIILVDNASTDSSPQFVKKNYPNVKIIPYENHGWGAACNRGAEAAKGEYLMFFNEDMYLPEDFCEKMVTFRKQYEKKYNNIGAIGCKITPFDTNPDQTPEYYGGKLDLLGFPSDNHNPQKPVFIINGCPFFIRKDVFWEVGGYDEHIFLYGEDADIAWRLKLYGYVNNDTYLPHFGGGIVGTMRPQKLAYVIHGSFILLLTNYHFITLIFILPIYFLYFWILNIGLFLFTKGNYRYNLALIQTYWKTLQKLPSIAQFRKKVQQERKKNDFEMLHYFTVIPSVVLNVYYKRIKKKN
jgi:GT2 family glycosyltransferase